MILEVSIDFDGTGTPVPGRSLKERVEEPRRDDLGRGAGRPWLAPNWGADPALQQVCHCPEARAALVMPALLPENPNTQTTMLPKLSPSQRIP